MSCNVSGDRLFSVFLKLRYVIVLLWICALVGSAYFATKFIDATTLEFSAPRNSIAQEADDAFDAAFGTQLEQTEESETAIYYLERVK